MLCLIGSVLLVGACRRPSSTLQLSDAMHTYDRLILKTDGDSIALLYAVDGDLGSIAHGRDSIRQFLSKFKQFKVLEQVSIIDSEHIDHGIGYLSGTYHQKVVVPATTRDTVTVKGRFFATWIQNTEYGWQIKKMETRPIP